MPDEGSAAAMLGVGWKARPCITLEPGTSTMLADVEGPGVIQHRGRQPYLQRLTS